MTRTEKRARLSREQCLELRRPVSEEPLVVLLQLRRGDGVRNRGGEGDRPRRADRREATKGLARYRWSLPARASLVAFGFRCLLPGCCEGSRPMGWLSGLSRLPSVREGGGCFAWPTFSSQAAAGSFRASLRLLVCRITLEFEKLGPSTSEPAAGWNERETPRPPMVDRAKSACDSPIGSELRAVGVRRPRQQRALNRSLGASRARAESPIFPDTDSIFVFRGSQGSCMLLVSSLSQ